MEALPVSFLHMIAHLFQTESQLAECNKWDLIYGTLALKDLHIHKEGAR